MKITVSVSGIFATDLVVTEFVPEEPSESANDVKIVDECSLLLNEILTFVIFFFSLGNQRTKKARLLWLLY